MFFLFILHFLFCRRDYLIIIMREYFANYGIIYELILQFCDCVFRVSVKVSLKICWIFEIYGGIFIIDLT